MIKRFIRKHLPALISTGLFVALFVYTDVQSIFEQIKKVPAATAGLMFICLLTTPIWAALRFWRVLTHFGVGVSWRACLRATVSGQVASLFMIPIFGQVAGRQLLLAQSGLSPESNAALAAYERLATAFISGLCALAGAAYLLMPGLIEEFMTKIGAKSIMVPLVLGTLMSCVLGLSRFEWSILKRLKHFKNLRNFVEIIAISFAGYAAMILAFLSVFTSIAPDLSTLSLIAASAMISFVASLPVSIGGWGPRELTAGYVLGILGVAMADAIAASVVVGTLSIAAVLTVALCVSRMGATSNLSTDEQVNKRSESMLEKEAAWFFGMSVATLVFFQAQMPIGVASVNFNLADPFAFLALTAVFLSAVMVKKYPLWELPQFNKMILMGTCLLMFGFVWGWGSHGFSQWAFAGKLLGWFVLLGYMSAGYLIVAYHGAQGISRSIRTMLSLAAATGVFTLVSALESGSGFVVLVDYQPLKALSLQLVPVMALSLGASSFLKKELSIPEAIIYVALLTAVVGLLFLSPWDAIKLCGMAVILVALLLLSSLRKFIGFVLVVAFISWVCSEVLIDYIPPPFEIELATRAVDFETSKKALEIWKSAPFFGVGLGGFYEASVQSLGQPAVVNNTLIWFLVDFGILGFCGLAWGAFLLAKHALYYTKRDIQRQLLVLFLVGTMFLSIFQEVLYQRILWFGLGLLLAKPNSAIKEV
jgi:uncharacterized membrane protein YbhN (UPF0104 family)